MSRHVATILLLFQQFPTVHGNSTRHGRDMEHEFCRLRSADFPRWHARQEERAGVDIPNPDQIRAILHLCTSVFQ
jgi:hypothetical protein